MTIASGERMCMDLNLVDSSDVPVPPEDVRIRGLQVMPLSDGRRLRVEIELTPFQKPPTIDVTIENARGVELASTSVIEAMTPQMSFMMHLNAPVQEKAHRVVCVVHYIDGPQTDEKTLILTPE
jgi:hypothetical protein